MLGRVIVELSELTGFRRAELESLKAFISRRDDGATRLAYRRDPETALRRCILVGTSNDVECLPNDPSGNTRFVPIQCGEGSHVEPYLDKHRGQLWAEGLALYRKGERANLPRDLMDLQAAHGELHRRKDAIIEDDVARDHRRRAAHDEGDLQQHGRGPIQSTSRGSRPAKRWVDQEPRKGTERQAGVLCGGSREILSPRHPKAILCFQRCHPVSPQSL